MGGGLASQGRMCAGYQWYEGERWERFLGNLPILWNCSTVELFESLSIRIWLRYDTFPVPFVDF